ncbi:DUF4136 domain-containing protein [Paraburkholderia sp. B3]|uniref:DUF4136 domain-containing protein n=1 Tax=Paraburkholderia sp. B3 TaxID=3134791 RepID=UPI0039829722
MKILLTVCLFLTAGALAGCAGVNADVSARGALPDAGQRTVVYRLARTPAEAEAVSNPPYEALLRDGLAKRGFVDGAPEKAAYVVSAAWSTRPADVGIAQGDCAPACEPAAGSPFPWFGRPYVHALTLRFFALPGGAEAYRVSVVKHDRNANAQEALPYLVASALARLPYAGAAGAPQWRVKLREAGAEAGAGGEGGAGALPEVISVKAVAPAQ